MIVDRQWFVRNLGYDPLGPRASRALRAVTAKRPAGSRQDLAREIIDFDSEAEEGRRLFATSTATGLAKFADIPWPQALAPRTGAAPKGKSDRALPRADVLVVTWTVDEGHALSRVLTPGKDSRDDWRPYTHNFGAIAAKMRNGCPARELQRLGTWWQMTIGATSVVMFKSDSHLSQDGPQMPNAEVWQQIIAEVQPRLVITTGTAGGIGAQFEVGDVVVSPVVRFDCLQKFKKQDFHNAHYRSAAPRTRHFTTAKALFQANAARLPPANTRPPKIVRVATGSVSKSVVTTDFFGFDTSDDHYHLQGLGDVSEMGDAVLGLVVSRMNGAAPRWVAVRNVSDPQIKAEGSLRDQARIAAQIYKGFGRWSSVCSAIVCWALIAAE